MTERKPHSGCDARCELDELERACIGDPGHDGEHADADGEWFVGGERRATDPRSRGFWLGSWW